MQLLFKRAISELKYGILKQLGTERNLPGKSHIHIQWRHFILKFTSWGKKRKKPDLDIHPHVVILQPFIIA